MRLFLATWEGRVPARPQRSIALVALLLAIVVSCHHARPAATPEAALGGLLDAATDQDETKAALFLTPRTVELFAQIERAAREIHATNVPEHVLRAFLANLAREAPDLTGSKIDGDHATLSVYYRSGHPARLSFVRDVEGWKLDLTHDLEPSLALLQGAHARLDALARGEVVKSDDDD